MKRFLIALALLTFCTTAHGATLEWVNPTTYEDGSPLDVVALNAGGAYWYSTVIFQGPTIAGPWTAAVKGATWGTGAKTSVDISHLMPTEGTVCWSVQAKIRNIASDTTLSSEIPEGVCYTATTVPPPPPPPPPATDKKPTPPGQLKIR